VSGVEIKQTAPLDFPKTDLTNPEINRMWAGIGQSPGSRTPIAVVTVRLQFPEIIRLGEDFSIATGIHVVLVLENDAEYPALEDFAKNLERTSRASGPGEIARTARRHPQQSPRQSRPASGGIGGATKPTQLASAAPIVKQATPTPSAQRSLRDFQ